MPITVAKWLYGAGSSYWTWVQVQLSPVVASGVTSCQN